MTRWIKSIPCKECSPWASRGWWEYDSYDKVARCGNCGFKRPYSPRKAGNTLTPSQERALERIKRVTRDFSHMKDEADFRKFDWEVNERFGYVWLTIHTHENVFLNHWITISIGRKGGIELVHFSDGVSGREHSHKMAGYYIRRLGAKFSKQYGK